jgi:hypothetical protein
MPNDDDDIVFTPVLDEGILQCRHDIIPIYIPSLRTTLTIGHFVAVSPPHGRSFVGQIIGRPSSLDSVIILPFLPLFSPEINDSITNITLLPRSISANVCRNMVELF